MTALVPDGAQRAQLDQLAAVLLRPPYRLEAERTSYGLRPALRVVRHHKADGITWTWDGERWQFRWTSTRLPVASSGTELKEVARLIYEGLQ